MTRLLAILLCSALTVGAADFDPVRYVHTATGTIILWQEFRADQFPRWANTGTQRRILVACPLGTWQAADPRKRELILSKFRRFLAGDDDVSVAQVQALVDALADANVRVVLCDDPIAQLAEWGVRQP